jgi:Phosphoribosylanthranilate isomerase
VQHLIKASRIAHLTDARYFAAMEVDFLGFNLEEGTEGYLDPMYMKAIREWVQGPRIVGEFSVSPISVVKEAARFFGLDAVQVSAEAHGEQLALLEGLEVLVEHTITDARTTLNVERWKNMVPYSDFFIVVFPEDKPAAEILRQNPHSWKEVFSLRPSLLQGNVAPSEWPGLAQEFGLAGISVVGGGRGTGGRQVV